MVKQLLEGLQNNFSDHSVAISNKKSIDYFIGIKRLFFLLDFFCDLKYLIGIISRKYFDRIVASFKKYVIL